MDRRAFFKASCMGCAGLAVGIGTLSLQGCASIPLVHAVSDQGVLRVPLTSFTKGAMVIARTDELPEDILVLKRSDGSYASLYLRCTHRDQPLSATATGIHCPSHGSRFALDGAVLEGPATIALRMFRTSADAEQVIIELKNQRP